MGDGGRGERDGEVDLPSDYMGGLLTRLNAVLDEVRAVAWSTQSASELRAAVRELTASQSRLESARFPALVEIEGRDDVVPRSRAGQAAVTFLQHSVGMDHATAKRDVAAARLLELSTGDLKVMGAAFAAGQVLRGHVEVAVRTHRDLGPKLREEIVPLDVNPETGEVPEDSRFVRRIEALDELLTLKSQRLGVKQVDDFARELVEALNPREPAGAHERRFLYASAAKDGSVSGKFACGPTQGALLLAVLAAWNAPRPGLGIDQDGVEHVLPDSRDLGQRNMDALTDALALATTRAGITLPPGAGTRPDPEPWPDTFGQPDEQPDETDDEADDEADDEVGDTSEESEEPEESEPPAGEGEYTVVREPGVLSGPYPQVKILITVGIEHLARALARTTATGRPDPTGLWSFGTSPPPGPPAPPQTPLPLAEVVERSRGQAWIQHVGHPPDTALAELFTNARLQRVLHTREGAVLAMGRTVRLATPAQKDALIARDRTCVIPGCTVPGEHCQVHHVIPWAAGGPTDLDNLVSLCVRHHTETGQGTWEIEMINGVPWVRVPSWIDRTRPLLRNLTHQKRSS